jgi:hypothetical protein
MAVDTRLHKISVLKSKSENLDTKIKGLQSQKKKYDKEIKELEQQLFMSIIRENNYTIPTLENDIELLKVLKNNNISTQQDVFEMLELIQLSGGQNNEEN